MRRPALILLWCLTLLAATAAKAQTPSTKTEIAKDATKPSVAPKAISLPLFFEANKGQADPRVHFMARSNGYTLLLTPTKTILAEAKTEISAAPKGFASPKAPNFVTSAGTRIEMQLVRGRKLPPGTLPRASLSSRSCLQLGVW
jgi:hypothetical protein